ncbi:hypothetical protein O9929_08380 [Vibrio lentus]|nr:hypothetical protein [Vibrio lentus]
MYGHAGTGKTFVASRIVNASYFSFYPLCRLCARNVTYKVFSAQHHTL